MLFLRYDGIILYEGENVTQEARIRSYSGNYIPYPMISNTSAMTVRFISDHTVTRPGFNISYASSKFAHFCSLLIQYHFRDKNKLNL